MRRVLALVAITTVVGCNSYTLRGTDDDKTADPPPTGTTTPTSTPTTETDGPVLPTDDTAEPPADTADTGSTTTSTTTTTTPSTAGPIQVGATCGTSGPGLDSWIDPAATEPELHVLGVYEPDNGTSITVTIERPTEMVLVLSSYEPVEWNLVVDPAVTLTAVIVNGYEPQTVLGTTAPIDNHSPYVNGWFGDIGYAWSDPGTQTVVAAAEAITGLPLASFHGCYDASTFGIR